MSLWDVVAKQISEHTGRPFRAAKQQSIGGGCINDAYKISDGDQSYFIKLNRADREDMFAAEAAGLAEMFDTQTIRVPQAIGAGSSGSQSYLILEYIPLRGRADPSELGEQLAAMHQVQQSQFGWWRDNTIGSTPQLNEQTDDWITFWREQRLGYQYDLAARNGFGGRLQRQGEKLLAELTGFFDGYTPAASLLHGDLWGGNCSGDGQGHPVIYDPAVYYGDRETDLAMTELFGGFGAAFFQAYHATYPIDAGYKTRKTLYNLYHILNHVNLFGSGYVSQAQHMTDQLLSEVR